MSNAAATIACYHICPAYDGDHAHEGGLILEGSTNVHYGNRSAARRGDQLQCQSSSPDQITQGSPSVFINGKAAARLGDPTAHGGVITQGIETIFIG